MNRTTAQLKTLKGGQSCYSHYGSYATAIPTLTQYRIATLVTHVHK